MRCCVYVAESTGWEEPKELSWVTIVLKFGIPVPKKDTGTDVPEYNPPKSDYLRNRSPMACFITSPPTSEIERVRGMSLGQASTQF